MKSFKQFLKDEDRPSRAKTVIKKLAALKKPKPLPVLDEVLITSDGKKYQRLDEGRKWIDGRFKKNIGIDKPTHGADKSTGTCLVEKAIS